MACLHQLRSFWPGDPPGATNTLEVVIYVLKGPSQKFTDVFRRYLSDHSERSLSNKLQRIAWTTWKHICASCCTVGVGWITEQHMKEPLAHDCSVPSFTFPNARITHTMDLDNLNKPSARPFRCGYTCNLAKCQAAISKLSHYHNMITKQLLSKHDTATMQLWRFSANQTQRCCMFVFPSEQQHK